MKPTIVTLDGPAGVGKSTIAKRVAGALAIAYLDTGAMFRAVAFKLGAGSWGWPEDELRDGLQGLCFRLHGTGELSGLVVNEEFLDRSIRTEEVGMWASNLARLPVVRDYLKEAQREIGLTASLVAEGRDMGTVIFPQAAHKFFLDASIEERARRRWLQLQSMDRPADLEEIRAAIAERDEQDRNRPVAPLRPAEDAVVIDTSDMNKDEVFATIMGHIRSKADQ
jgi:cytidylate kinase